MVRNKGAALVALALAGAAYFFRNKQQVKRTFNQMTEKAEDQLQNMRGDRMAQSGGSIIGDGSERTRV